MVSECILFGSESDGMRVWFMYDILCICDDSDYKSVRGSGDEEDEE